MREESEQRFRRLLEQHDRELLAAAAARAEHGVRDQAWDTRFHDRVRDVVHPVMDRLRSLMHEYELKSEIITTRRRTEADGTVVPSSIAFEFRVLTDPETHGFPITVPSLTLIADAASRAVLVHENTMLPYEGGHVGLVARIGLEELTGAAVEDHLYAVAQKILRGTDAQ